MELRILDALNGYSKKKPVRFHMPGHKGDKKFNRLFRQAGLDITELAFSDNLANPQGIIKQVEDEIGEILGAKKSFMLTDGSSAGVYAMLKAVSDKGSKIIICRNSHVSVYNACEVLGIEPYILNHNYKDGIVLPPSLEEIENLFKKDENIIGVLLTCPDYFGNIPDLAKVKRICQSYQRLLLIDGAHGGHLKFFEDAENYAGKYADLWVDGLHKTMPVLSQGAAVSAGREDLAKPLESAVKYFRTTSPSYPIMASIEYGVKFMLEQGGQLIETLALALDDIKQRLEARGYRFYKSKDVLKLSVDFESVGISAKAAESYLNKKGIYAELCDGRYILFYMSALTKPRTAGKLERLLKRMLRNKKLKNTYKAIPEVKTGKKSFSYTVAAGMAKQLVPLNESEGKICGKNVGIFPPAFPVITAGEVITKETVDFLKKADNVFGLDDGNVYIV